MAISPTSPTRASAATWSSGRGSCWWISGRSGAVRAVPSLRSWSRWRRRTPAGSRWPRWTWTPTSGPRCGSTCGPSRRSCSSRTASTWIPWWGRARPRSPRSRRGSRSTSRRDGVGGGTLYVVATPLGHLGDLTTRAAELLRSVPTVAAEDTRRTRVLLAHLDAHPRLISYHAHSAPGAAAGILETLRSGQDLALVTDAGTPGVSDPGAALVAEVRAAGYAVVPLPGASAVTAALSAAGLPADRYLFLGLLPRNGAERARLLERLAREEWTAVLFEAPGRVGDLLADLATTCGPGRRAVVARELTKVHEEFRTGTLGELAGSIGTGEEELRGECTVVVEGSPAPPADDSMARARPAAARLLAAGISRREVTGMLTELFGVGRNEAYDLVQGLGRE